MNYIISESQIAKMIKKFFKKDFRIDIIQHWDELPSVFKKVYSQKFHFTYLLNRFGPMFLIYSGNKLFLVQEQKKDEWIIHDGDAINDDNYWLDYVDDDGNEFYDENEVDGITEEQLMSLLGVAPLGISLNQFIDAYYSE
jgi:hypothetical protein